MKKRRPLSEINVVPYIDVTLVLLVIFMITAPLLMQGIHVQLPHAKTKALSPKKEVPLVVSIDREGKYYLNVSPQPTKPLTALSLMTQVAARLSIAKEKHEKKTIYVKGDRGVDYGIVVHAMALLQKAGAQHIGLITQEINTQEQLKLKTYQLKT